MVASVKPFEYWWTYTHTNVERKPSLSLSSIKNSPRSEECRYEDAFEQTIFSEIYTMHNYAKKNHYENLNGTLFSTKYVAASVVTDRQTHRTTTVTLAHVCRGLMTRIFNSYAWLDINAMGRHLWICGYHPLPNTHRFVEVPKSHERRHTMWFPSVGRNMTSRPNWPFSLATNN